MFLVPLLEDERKSLEPGSFVSAIGPNRIGDVDHPDNEFRGSGQ